MSSAARGRPRRLDPELDEHRVHALLLNWARMARGWPQYLGFARFGEHDSGPAPDAAAADKIEAVLCSMKRCQPKLWRSVKFSYLAGYSDETSAHAMSTRRQPVSVNEFRGLILRAYAWIHASLEGDS